jgi:hypothetical protein
VSPATPGTVDLLAEAVADNARWVAAVAATHGIGGRVDGGMWSADAATPDGYPEAVTTRPGLDPRHVVDRLAHVPGPVSVKDSHADLDLAWAGFEVLFEGSWLASTPLRAVGHPGPSSPGPAPRCWRVGTVDELSAWRRTWSGGGDDGPLGEALLSRPEVSLLAWGDRARPVTVAVATAGPRAVGLSNLAGPDGVLDRLAFLAAATERWPGLPVVGYESGPAVADAQAAGFVALAPMRVWTAAPERRTSWSQRSGRPPDRPMTPGPGG